MWNRLRTLFEYLKIVHFVDDDDTDSVVYYL